MAVATPTGLCSYCGKAIDDHFFHVRSSDPALDRWLDVPLCPPKQVAA